MRAKASSFPLIRNHVDQTQGNFAFQAIAGLSFPIPRVPGLSITAEYRFFGIPGSETFNGAQVVSGVPGLVSGRLQGGEPVQP